MKRPFATNWYISRTCLSTAEETKMLYDIGEKASGSEESRSCNRCFEELLLEAVDEELSLLGISVKRTVYHHLKKTFKIEKNSIPHRIDEFTNAIERIFGNGARLLEIQIMKRLYEKVGRNIEYLPRTDDLLFIEYVEAAKLSSSC